jgi:eukaryotic-like serine/threonine-protein kinase
VSAGTILAGKYRLIGLIGRGGMGSVWKAEHLGWEAPVAIKLMNVTHNPQALARFQREARLAAGLRSPHVVQVLDDGVDEMSGAPFIVMELLEGESLAERLGRVKRMRPEVVAQVITQIARALGRAHEVGLIHRDLKPDNVLLVRNDDEEVVKVLDFGIAKFTTTEDRIEESTLAGHVMGTPAYMSPEQLTSQREIDHRSDLWSLAVIACECMTGARPFEGDNLVALAFKICANNPPRPSTLGPVPEGFDDWFLRAIAQDPRDRFSSAKLMAEELRGLCGHLPMFYTPEGAPPLAHSTSAVTELEPVIELTRRVEQKRASHEPLWSITELASVLPTERPPSARVPEAARSWLALLVGLALFAGALAFWQPQPLRDMASRIGRWSLELRERLRAAAEPTRGSTTTRLSSTPAHVEAAPATGPSTPLAPPEPRAAAARAAAASAAAPAHTTADAGSSAAPPRRPEPAQRKRSRKTRER